MADSSIQPRLNGLRDLAVANVLWRGRASRRMLFASIGLMYAFGLLLLPLSLAEVVARPGTPAALVLRGLNVMIGLVMGAFFLGAMVRRLHDRGKAAWWLLLFVGPHAALVFLATRFLPTTTPSMPPLLIVGMVIDMALLFWWMSETFFLRGALGPNRFGPDPLAERPSPATAATSDASP
ncbi:MAG: DUF805 domain-containing protein [Phenylobacterium sp.]|uniref:DUF805 domain-containing protein n=1 Tax=Phenylobacterium sp. TaxID=1871053 RepID=UPI0012132C0F|nr:DUF805 domain-containing protein [Phenylobacterium sp.]TAL34248.1 MAG: DUF805 domain-containing protein [Phenylobacterium sp.]